MSTSVWARRPILSRDRRYANTSDVGLYIKGIASGKPFLSEDYTISSDEALSESMILGLRMNMGINLNELSQVFGLNVRNAFHEKLMNLSSKELVDYTGAMVRLTKKGMDYLIRSLLSLFRRSADKDTGGY
jgi:oxygen-independent coproporphyrinogen-3 oxidase